MDINSCVTVFSLFECGKQHLLGLSKIKLKLFNPTNTLSHNIWWPLLSLCRSFFISIWFSFYFYLFSYSLDILFSISNTLRKEQATRKLVHIMFTHLSQTKYIVARLCQSKYCFAFRPNPKTTTSTTTPTKKNRKRIRTCLVFSLNLLNAISKDSVSIFILFISLLSDEL